MPSPCSSALRIPIGLFDALMFGSAGWSGLAWGWVGWVGWGGVRWAGVLMNQTLGIQGHRGRI